MSIFVTLMLISNWSYSVLLKIFICWVHWWKWRKTFDLALVIYRQPGDFFPKPTGHDWGFWSPTWKHMNRSWATGAWGGGKKPMPLTYNPSFSGGDIAEFSSMMPHAWSLFYALSWFDPLDMSDHTSFSSVFKAPQTYSFPILPDAQSQHLHHVKTC